MSKGREVLEIVLSVESCDMDVAIFMWEHCLKANHLELFDLSPEEIVSAFADGYEIKT